MGYSIPPGDYSIAPLQINVGAELGKSFSKAIDAYGAIKRKEREDAKKLAATQNAFKNKLLLNQNELKTGYFKSLEAAGIKDDPSKENELFDQFKEQIDIKAKAALEARMKMEFNTDISDDERIKLAQTVTDFKTFSQNSLTQMGGLIADADSFNSMDTVVVGDPMNGEQLGNTLALQNINGVSARTFDPNAITSRKLTTQGNQNIVTSTVKIPVGSDYFKTASREGGGISNVILQRGIDEGIIKTENINGKDFYVFKNDINVSNYSTKGGMDLVQGKMKVQNSDEVLQANKFISKQGAFNSNFINQNPVVTTEVEKDSFGKKTGYQKTVDYNVVDVGSMVEDKAYLAEMNAEYSSIFENPEVSYAQKQQYLIDIGVTKSVKELQNLDKDVAKKLVIGDMISNMWEGYFPGAYKSSGSNAQQVQVQLGKKEKGEYVLDATEEKLLKSVQDQGLKNPVTGELYQPGDSIYVIRTETSRVVADDSTGGKGTESQILYGKVVEALENNNLEVFAGAIKAPGDVLYKYFEAEGDSPAGVYEVTENNGVYTKQGKSVSPNRLISVFKIGTKD